jgi:site-specific recombinase XerD
MADIHFRKFDLEGYKEKLEQATLDKNDKKLILDFDVANTAQGLTAARRLQYARLLGYMRGLRCLECGTIKSKKEAPKGRFKKCRHKFAKEPWLKTTFAKATKEDIVKLMDVIQKQGFAHWTVQGYKITLKKFYRWLMPQTRPDDYPEQVAWINTRLDKTKQPLPEQLLTTDDINALVKVCNNLRDRAIILCLYESGCRAGELFTRKIKHVQFDKYGAVLLVDGKTGMRRVRLIASKPALSAWLDLHPNRNNPDAPLWVVGANASIEMHCKKCGYEWIGSDRTADPRCSKCDGRKIELGERRTRPNRELTYKGLYSLLKTLFARAGIKKKFHPHLFRHSRATELANKLTEAQMKEIFGWTQGSNMAATYVHLSGRDIDNALLKLHGLLEEEEQEDGFKAIKCPVCKFINLPKTKFCASCSTALSIEAATAVEEQRKIEKEDLMKEILVSLKKELKPGAKVEHYNISED